MSYADAIRNCAAFYLAAVEWFTAPLRVLARLPAASDEERKAQQQEVWDEWAKQPAPHKGLLFD